MSNKFNDTIDSLGKKINSVASSAKEKTVKIAKATQIRIDIKSAESSLDLVYEDLGRAYYASLREQAYKGETVEMLLIKADNLKEKIKSLEESLKSYSNNE